ncbi:YoaK family protein [Oryzifoliimicrobium ureilyticus]|uniref:YoaK family protein n=1 Tax=Oryzifoliimicrobium ureilyticus TaxID=3113724 RepID=UPI0030767B1F
MLVSQGAARNERVNLHLACYLAGIAGALNAAAFYSVGFFSANMTGNVSTLSDHLATKQWLSSIFYFAIVITFISGATLSSLLINAGLRRRIRGIYALSIFTEASILTLLGFADILLESDWRSPFIVIGLALLMGLQNATVTRISNARVRTTHVSGMATDIGIELGIAIDIHRGKAEELDAIENRAKLRLHLYTILSFLAGGIIGVLIYQAIAGYLLFICSGLLYLAAIDGLRRR